ncbi:hypothetical protein K470DRAFT_212471 [Piedraia hortae CBS 480.64]|uniref:GPR1/FUN34/YaaH-class plasma membrane protein n=1 Tax=Piedraia hortae CBS 480.64 TaxID=1314780 RepID=A0A6A7C768_9PEZI|nr:hypothetical protein K470DRAFT_212471 [Piedraia hortae CBS 480.64]
MPDEIPLSDLPGSAELTRNVTINLSQAQYERMFFQPNQPRHGDYAKRFANPTLLGPIGLTVPLTSTVLCLLGTAGAVPPYSTVGVLGDYYMIGVISMVIAGLAEFILGNTFPFALFVLFGAHWGAIAYQQDPITQNIAAFAKLGGPAGKIYNSSQTFHYAIMALFCAMIAIASIRVNVVFIVFFFALTGMFASIAGAHHGVPTESAEWALHRLKIAGGFGVLAMVMGWYLLLVTMCETVGLPCPLPVFDLSGKVFKGYQEKMLLREQGKA